MRTAAESRWAALYGATSRSSLIGFPSQPGLQGADQDEDFNRHNCST